MTVTDAPARPRPRDAGRASPMSLWRLLWLELRRNAMPWMFPLLAALFVFDPFRTAMGYGPFWDLRASVLENKLLPDFVSFVAGVAAWMGSRDSRRHTADLVDGDRPAPLDGAARHLGRHHALGGRAVPDLRGGAVRGHREPGHLGRAAVVAGSRQPAPNWPDQRPGVRGRHVLPQPVHRAAGRGRRVPALPGRVPERGRPVQRVCAALADHLRARRRHRPVLPLPAGRVHRAADVPARAHRWSSWPPWAWPRAADAGPRLRRAAAVSPWPAWPRPARPSG